MSLRRDPISRTVTSVREAAGDRHPSLLLGLPLCLLLDATVLGLTWNQASSAITSEMHQREAGSLIVTVRAHDTPLPASDCTSLERTDGVAAAGGLLTSTSSGSVFAGAPPVEISRVTPGALDVWAPGSDPTAVYVGRDLASTMSVTVGTHLISEGNTLTVDRLLPEVPSSAIASRVLVPAPATGTVSECWIRAVPGAIDIVLPVVEATFAREQAETVRFVAAPHGLTPLEVWNGFSTTHVWLLAAALKVLVVALLAWVRRSHWAIYRAFGMSSWQLHVMLTAQAWAVLALSWLALTTCGLLIAGFLPSSSTALSAAVALREVSAASLMGAALAPLVLLIATRGDVSAALKDR